MTQHNPNDQDDERLAALLRTLDSSAPPPDRTLLDKFRQHSAELFLSGGTDIAPAGTAREPSPTIRRRSKMSIAFRGMVALAATIAGLAIWLGTWPLTLARGAAPFSEVVEELRGAQTLEFQVVKEGRTATVWVRAPGLVRREESPERYEIAAGSRLWKVDETNNTVTEHDSPWFINPEQQVDLLGLLDVGIQDASPLLAARPFHRLPHDGRDCFVYRVALPASQGRVQVEAFVDATNKQLVGIVAWSAGVPRGANPPLAELNLVAKNMAVSDEKFVVAKSLTEDGRIGKVSDAQGIVVLRPMLAKRWTPVCRETLLKPGDWLRTELRGANAVKVSLSSQVELTLGPGSLLECISPTTARLHGGQAQVKVPTQKDAEQNIAF